MQIIIFTKADKYYGIPTAHVGEIIKNTRAYHVPQAPEMVSGLINLRGAIITLINFSNWLKEPDTARHENIIIIMTETNARIGLLVEGIVGVQRIEEAAIQVLEKSNDSYLTGIIALEGQKIVNLLDVMTIFSENEGLN